VRDLFDSLVRLLTGSFRDGWGNDLQLALIHPPGNGDQQKTEWVENSPGLQSLLSRLRVDGEASRIHADPVSGPYEVRLKDRPDGNTLVIPFHAGTAIGYASITMQGSGYPTIPLMSIR
jgi:hypothetical protein